MVFSIFVPMNISSSVTENKDYKQSNENQENPLSQPITLHQADNAWKPSVLRESALNKSELLRRNIQAILNKLTVEKFDILTYQLKRLNFKTGDELNILAELIFENALCEPLFSPLYANLSLQMVKITMPVVHGQPNQSNLRKLLLTKCQREFEQDRCDEMMHKERLKSIVEVEPEKQKELKLVYEEKEKKAQDRYLGNIRFIGELFNFGMIIYPIMHECIQKLLSQEDEKSLECLCKLFKTMGKELIERDEAAKEQNERMDAYFVQMQNYVDKRLTSTRIRYMLQDVIDLKKNNWIPRRIIETPKSLEEIHAEFMNKVNI